MFKVRYQIWYWNDWNWDLGPDLSEWWRETYRPLEGEGAGLWAGEAAPLPAHVSLGWQRGVTMKSKATCRPPAETLPAENKALRWYRSQAGELRPQWYVFTGVSFPLTGNPARLLKTACAVQGNSNPPNVHHWLFTRWRFRRVDGIKNLCYDQFSSTGSVGKKNFSSESPLQISLFKRSP